MSLHRKKILLAISGLAPQVISEALYALFSQGRMVDQVRVITTRKGKELLLSRLLAPVDGKLYHLLADFNIAPESIDFNPGSLKVLRNSAGEEIEDIVSFEDNESLLQTCLAQAFDCTLDPESSVYFLVAGGRKTMTSCLTLAAQLYGRRQDRLYHVLVSPEFENCPDFWFPPRDPVLVQLRDAKGQPYWKETRYAKIELISIPFISVRERLAAEMLDKPYPPAELMQSLIRDKPRQLTISLADCKLIFGNMELDLPSAWLALYAFFAEQKKSCSREQRCEHCTSCYLSTEEVINNPGVLAMYQRIAGNLAANERSDSGVCSLSKENFYSYKSRIKTAITRAFGQSQAEELTISASGSRPESRYGLKIDRRRIRVEW